MYKVKALLGYSIKGHGGKILVVADLSRHFTDNVMKHKFAYFK
jgi:hypothetical protein